jgi:acetolactate synthase-1/2/3 large subunit
MPTRLQADGEALAALADRLVQAERPVILAEYAGRFPGAAEALVALAELIGAPVVGPPGRFNIASNHALHLTDGHLDVMSAADVVLAVEVPHLFASLYTGPRRKPAPGPKIPGWLAHVTLGDIGIKAWSQDFQELAPLDCEIRADAGLAMPELLRLCRERIDDAGRARAGARRDAIREQSEAQRAAVVAKAESLAEKRPIALPYLALALAKALESQPWVITLAKLRGWLWRLLPVEDPSQWAGINAGGGLGNGLGFSLGVAPDRRDDDVVCVDVQGDGDLLYTPSALRTAAQYHLPLLIVVNNNRSYYNSEDHAIQVAGDRGRAVDRAGVGTQIGSPLVDFAALARSFGVEAAGPVEDPAALIPTLRRAVTFVREQKAPMLVDVICGLD